MLHKEVINSRGAKEALTPGRVVFVKLGTGPPEPAIILRSAAQSSAPSAAAPARPRLVLSLNNTPSSSVNNANSESNDPSRQLYIIALNRGFPSTNTKPDAAPAPAPSTSQPDPAPGRIGLGGRIGKGQEAPKQSQTVKLPYHGLAGEVAYIVMQVSGDMVLQICKSKVKVEPEQILESMNPVAATRAVQSLQDILDNSNEVESLDPVKDLKLNEIDIVESYLQRSSCMEAMAAFKCHACPKLADQYGLVYQHRRIKERIQQLKYEVSDAALQQLPEYHQRMQVLEQLGYIDEEKVVQMKGRVMCELNSCDELVASEMIFAGVLADLEPEAAVALLSAFVFQEKTENEPMLGADLAAACQRIKDLALLAGALQKECGMDIDPQEYTRDILKFGLVEVVYEWAKGTPFADICMLTDVPEGSIVRTIVRLDEACREVKDAARLMGDSALFLKMQTASERIKRDIVFSASLYVSKA